jgi:hypothetical protein
MDTSIITSIIIAAIAIIPGVWSLINLSKKDNESQLAAVSHSTSRLSDEIWEIKGRMVDFSTENLFKKMYEKPVIIRCDHCKSPNVITNFECIKCGAPLGD